MKRAISVIVPVYNVENQLKKCIDSILTQTIRDLEVILIDDGSTDSSPEICDYYSKIDKRVSVIHKKNGGLSSARNAGLNLANGKYIGFVDSDDFIESEMYELLYKEALKSNSDAIYCGVNYIYNNAITKKSAYVEQTTCFRGENEIKNFLMGLIAAEVTEKNDTLFEPTVWKAIFSKKIIDDNNIRFVSERVYVSEDSIFDIDFVGKSEKICMIPNTLYNYRFNPKSLTTSYDENYYKKNKKLLTLGLNKLDALFNDTSVNLQYKRFFLTATRVSLIMEVRNCSINNLRKTLKNIKNICNDLEIQNVLKTYPWKKLPFKKKIMCVLIKLRNPLLILIVVKAMYTLNDYGKRG